MERAAEKGLIAQGSKKEARGRWLSLLLVAPLPRAKLFLKRAVFPEAGLKSAINQPRFGPGVASQLASQNAGELALM